MQQARAAIQSSSFPSQLGMARTIAREAVRERLTMVGVFAAILGVMAAGVGALWPSMRESMKPLQDALPDSILQFAGSSAINTPGGWVNAELMSFVAPGCLVAVAVICGVHASADEERTGRLGLLLSVPIQRSWFLLGKLAGIVVCVAVVAVALWVGTMVGSLLGDMKLSAGRIGAICVHAAALALVFGAFTVAVGATTSATRVVTVIVSFLTFISFLAAMFLPLSHDLWVAHGARLSPWHYFNASDPLTNGFNVAHLAVLAGIWLIASGCAVLIFQRRDLRG